MKKYLLIIVLILTNYIYSQVSGISGSKLCISDANTVAKGTFEFEPSILIFKTSNEFSDDGSLKYLNGENISSSMALRITAGLTDNFELGVTFPSSVEQISLGAKYTFIQTEDESIALISGISIPAGNRFIPDTLKDNDYHNTLSIGGVFSSVPFENFHLECAVAYTRIFGQNNFNNLISYGISTGYFLGSKIQPIIELTGFSTYNTIHYSDKLSFNYGVTIAINDRLLVLAGSQIDLLGQNEQKGVSYFSAFTISFK
jgi:hypothetical protein